MRNSLAHLGVSALFSAALLIASPAANTDPTSPPVDLNALKNRPNLHQTPVGTSGKWSMEMLNALTQAEGIALWRTLPAPTMAEMNGHYVGMGPGADDPEYQKRYAEYMFNEKSVRGYWLGKAFRPLSENSGEGYNRWRFPGGKVERNLRMATSIRNSIIDGKPTYVLDYSAFNKSTLYDEVRKLEDGVYIGAATTARPDGTRSKQDMFILVGPTDEWVGEPYTSRRPAAPAKDTASATK
jgi:hypothetical protein